MAEHDAQVVLSGRVIQVVGGEAEEPSRLLEVGRPTLAIAQHRGEVAHRLGVILLHGQREQSASLNVLTIFMVEIRKADQRWKVSMAGREAEKLFSHRRGTLLQGKLRCRKLTRCISKDIHVAKLEASRRGGGREL